MAAAIEAIELIKTYPPGVQALDGLSMSVASGTIFGLLGPNGAGKSTTVRVLSTLTRPDSGSARVAGIDVLADPIGVRRAIGVVGQKHGGAPEATGRENLVSQGELYGISGRELRGRVKHSLERFGLSDAADRPVRTLLRRHAAAPRHRNGAAAPSRRCCFSTSRPPVSTRRRRVDMWREIERRGRGDR